MVSTINLQYKLNLSKSVSFPVSKRELLKDFGEMPLSYVWENDTLILLKDILQATHTEIFNSELEFEMTLNKFLRRYKI